MRNKNKFCTNKNKLFTKRLKFNFFYFNCFNIGFQAKLFCKYDYNNLFYAVSYFKLHSPKFIII